MSPADHDDEVTCLTGAIRRGDRALATALAIQCDEHGRDDDVVVAALADLLPDDHPLTAQSRGKLALRFAARAIAADPTNGDAWCALIEAAHALGRVDDALDGIAAISYREARLGSELWLLAIESASALGDLEQALRIARRATGALPTDATLWAALALVAITVAPSTARDAAETALALDARDPVAWIARARIYSAGNQSVRAETAASTAVALGADRLVVDAIVFSHLLCHGRPCATDEAPCP